MYNYTICNLLYIQYITIHNIKYKHIKYNKIYCYIIFLYTDIIFRTYLLEYSSESSSATVFNQKTNAATHNEDHFGSIYDNK